jgi:hypothetical protein
MHHSLLVMLTHVVVLRIVDKRSWLSLLHRKSTRTSPVAGVCKKGWFRRG